MMCLFLCLIECDLFNNEFILIRIFDRRKPVSVTFLASVPLQLIAKTVCSDYNNILILLPPIASVLQ
jgi:hypothetical protein